MSANEVQEGGDHYNQPEGRPQHWDLAIMYQWDVFQYQITKYVFRWKDKHSTPEKRLEDLKKARHFLDKYIENWETYDTRRSLELSVVTKEQLDAPKPRHIGAFVANKTIPDPPKPEVLSATRTQGVLDQNWTCEGYLGSGMNVYKCRHCKLEIQHVSLEGAYIMHDTCSRAHMMFAAP